MSDDDQRPANAGSLLYYRQLEPLQEATHGGLGVSLSPTPYDYLADTHVIPLVTGEFVHAAVCYPIVFSAQSKLPLAIMGPGAGENVFIAEDGTMDPEAYVPAYARRYPFLPVATEGRQDPLGGGQRQVICIDRAARTISDNPEIPFFENGEHSQYTKDAIETCKQFDEYARRTREFVNLIERHDLFEKMDLSVPHANPDGTEAAPRKVEECLRISEKKLNQLPAHTYRKFQDAGIPYIVYAHLLSLGLWEKILSRTARRGAARGG